MKNEEQFDFKMGKLLGFLWKIYNITEWTTKLCQINCDIKLH